MNKIREFIRKHKKIIIALMLPCSFLPLIIVHVLFKWRSDIDFLVAEWSAGELLGYIGTLMSFWGTIILGWLALQASVDDKKDIADIADLRDFCSAIALSRVIDGSKGFAAAFSAKSTPSDKLISAITAKDSFQELLKYEEVILVAVNL